METFVKDRDGNCAFGIRFVDPAKGVQNLSTEGNVVGSWLASALKKGIVRVIARDASQLRMWKIEVVERNQRHGEVVGRRDQFVPEY